jgi:UDP-glucose 4-epimerase
MLTSALAAVDGVCHLAGRTRVRESLIDPLGYWQANVRGTLALLGAMLAAETKRLVLASTCVVYGEHADQPIRETAPTAPSSPYGHSKLAADHAAADLAATGALGAIAPPTKLRIGPPRMRTGSRAICLSSSPSRS